MVTDIMFLLLEVPITFFRNLKRVIAHVEKYISPVE